MEERKKEIDVLREVQRAEIKTKEDARHKITMELKDRQSKVDALRAKFETLAKSRIGPDGEGSAGEEVSQAYFVIKAAQIREELQRKGDELDSKIRIVEREMGALDSTLRHVVGANSKFRSGFQAADMNSKEGKKMITMKKRVKASGNVLFKKRKQVQRLTNDIEDVKVRSVGVRCCSSFRHNRVCCCI